MPVYTVERAHCFDCNQETAVTAFPGAVRYRTGSSPEYECNTCSYRGGVFLIDGIAYLGDGTRLPDTA